MGVSGFAPAPQINLDEFERRSREGRQRTGSNDAASKGQTKPLEVRSSPPSHLTPGDETSNVDIEDPRAFDVDEFRKWWRQSLTQEAAQDDSRGRKLARMTIALAGIALISSALALKGSAPTLLKRQPIASSANDLARAQNPGGETTSMQANIGTMSPVGATQVAPEADAHAIERLASKASAQTTDPELASRVSVRPDGTLIASQASSAAERWSAADAPKPPAKPASERMNGAVLTTQASTDLPPQRPSKVAARVVVAKAEAAALDEAADSPIPPLPIRAPAKPESEASEAKAAQPMTESIDAPATPAEAAQRPPNPFLRALGNLFGALTSPTRRSIDSAAVGSISLAVQLGAAKSEAEAKRDLKRLDTKYGSTLKRSAIAVRKVLVNGETAYRLQVVGLSRDEAAKLCSRVKSDGGSCSIVK
jgi:hypothetical protein